MYDKDAALIAVQLVTAVIQSDKLPNYDAREVASYYRNMYTQVLAGEKLAVTAKTMSSDFSD